MNFKKNLKIVRAITMCLALGTMGCINMNMVSASDNLQAPKVPSIRIINQICQEVQIIFIKVIK